MRSLLGVEFGAWGCAHDAARVLWVPNDCGGCAFLRRIGIRACSWMNWLYPMPF